MTVASASWPSSGIISLAEPTDGYMPESIETKVAVIERDIEYLRRNDDNERVELKALRTEFDSMRKEFDKLNQNYSNLLARGVGFTGAIVAIGAFFGWMFQYGAKIFRN